MIYYPVVRLRTGVSFCPPYGSGASSPAASATYEKWEGDPMARPDKVAAVAELKEKFSSAGATVLTEYRGLSVSGLQRSD